MAGGDIVACAEEIRKKQNSIAISYFGLQREYPGFFSCEHRILFCGFPTKP